MRDQHNQSYAIIIHNGLPYGLLPDMETAEEFVAEHDRLDADGSKIIWPIRELEP